MSRPLRLILILLTLSILGLAVSGQTIYARLSYLWILLIVANLLLARLSLEDIDLRRHARSLRLHVGDIFEEVFDVHNRGRLPRLWLEVSDASEIAGSSGSRVLTLVGAARTRSYVSRTRLAARGVYPLGPTKLASGDLFGLFSVEREFPVSHYLTVYPRIFPLNELVTPPGLMPGGEAIRRRTHQVTPNASTARDYVHGDPLSRIHWRSTARRSRLIVKEFELDPLAEIWIFLDAEKAVQSALPFTLPTDAGSVLFEEKANVRLQPSTEEYTASIAASIANYFLMAGRAVGMLSSGRSLDVLPADRGARQSNKIMESLALMQGQGETRFAGFVLTHARYLARGSTLFLVTPSVRPDILPLIDQLQRLGLRPAVILLDAATFGGQPGSQALAGKLSALNIPTVCVAEGDDLSEALLQLNHARGRVAAYALA
jgi:uncharacterized protein (DUF58 family)